MAKNNEIKANESTVNNEVTTINAFATGISSRLANILNRETKAVTTDNNGTEITTLSLNLQHKLANGAEKLEISNPLVIEAVERLQKLGDIETLTPSIKCVELARIANDVEAELGMKIDTFAYSVFNIQKKTALQYVRIGTYFYDSNGNMKSDKIPFLSTSQIIPLLARLGENGSLEEIESFFTPNEDGHSLLHGTDGANYIKKALKRYDSGELDCHGEELLTIAQKEARLAQERADRKAKKEAEKGSNNETKGDEELTPIDSFNVSLSRTLAGIDSLIAAYEVVIESKSMSENTIKAIEEPLHSIVEAVNIISEALNK
ncbi:MAG: hypothetical protein IJH65_07285 [Methanobrevibacter sp.]|nr:hypothetical protein [Methanobrevibacter sp.]